MLDTRMCLVLTALSLALPARAAELTDVADAADTVIIGETEREDIFDLYAHTGFRMNLANGKITREPIVRPGVTTAGCSDAANSRDCLPVDEMRWKRTTTVLDFGVEAGLFHDLAATLAFHYVIGDSMALRYAKGVTPAESSVDPKTGDPNDTLFQLGSTYDSGFRSKHSGFGNIDEFGYRTGGMDLGLRWAPLSDERDDSKPMWLLTFNWSNPWLAARFNPANRATESSPGSVGDGTHYITFGTALSKRVGNFGLIGIDPNSNRRGYVDPYMEFNYTLPVPSDRALREFTRDHEDFGRKPPHKAELNGGIEVVAVEDLRNSRKVAIDIGLRSAFVSEGRSYNELTDALGEVTYTEQYFNVTGLLAIYIQAAEFLRFKAGVTFGYNNEHFLTYEEVGDDLNGDGQVLPPDLDPNTTKDEINPYFCGNNSSTDSFSGQDRCSAQGLPSYDQVGFRFKDEEHVIFSWFATLLFTF